jgi:hypothetical protein
VATDVFGFPKMDLGQSVRLAAVRTAGGCDGTAIDLVKKRGVEPSTTDAEEP